MQLMIKTTQIKTHEWNDTYAGHWCEDGGRPPRPPEVPRGRAVGCKSPAYDVMRRSPRHGTRWNGDGEGQIC